MITAVSKRMMRKSFEKTSYRFQTIPEHTIRDNFGIYVHIPFCYTKCSFCPFYKEIYSENRKKRFLKAILKEIRTANIKREAEWVYFGGGTPNTLTIYELEMILKQIRKKAQFKTAGIELLPKTVTEEYLKGLKEIGFSKISIGVESFSDEVIAKTGRKNTTFQHIREVIEIAKNLDLWVNIDLMAGLPNQNPDIFRTDIQQLSDILPSQITIYPFMTIRGIKSKPGMEPKIQYHLIEETEDVLKEFGYVRKGVWTFTLGEDLYDLVYDSSRDELIEDYIGFGPAAFSTYGNWKVVNPELEIYIVTVDQDKRMGFVAPKTKSTDEWRKFARMIYDLRLNTSPEFPFYIRAYINILKLTGYGKNGFLTRKGKLFASALSKTVVESLPFPIQNAFCVENFEEYLYHKNIVKNISKTDLNSSIIGENGNYVQNDFRNDTKIILESE